MHKGRVAERQAESAARILGKNFLCPVKISAENISSSSTGSGIVLWSEYDNCVLGWDALGERGKYSEKVGEEAAIGLIKQMLSKATVDEYLSDQITPFLCFAKENSVFRVAKITRHLETNLWLLKKFFDVDFKVDGKEINVAVK